MPRHRKDWDLNTERLDRLLRLLGEDRYTRLHSRFAEYVRNNSSCDPEHVADVIIDRLAAKLEESQIPSVEIERYAYKIAQLVLQEQIRIVGKVGRIEKEFERMRLWINRLKPSPEYA